ncbi:DUF547 domain-containing protein [Microbulbifer rhizosphaerae]|uniref:DUF547 domain-containing protein n=1 Tax=Microbulbifer rhizosphaerae TaxID=1562603 RepID=A0A7W4W929_9GAMM|nr:DUF547 domain-containing protein [Microbulbifer rhizosphaerae]MBB3059913.1 hypothetical protein [Microbulbifer rhizosphaerae]
MWKFICFTVLAFFAFGTQAETFDHDDWNRLLQRHVVSLRDDHATAMDYAGIQRERAQLKGYLERMSAVEQEQFDRWPRREQLAFLINAYNAWTVELVLRGYPNIESIKDLGSLFRTPWNKAFVPLFGDELSLDDIEHKLIRGSGRYRDPRIHFAVNCASVGCPALRTEAYTGEQLEAQLEEQARLFLTDRVRNRLDGKVLKVSKIFKWYREDFERGWRGFWSLDDFWKKYAESLDLSPEDMRLLQSGVITVEYLDYDWRLNETPAKNLAQEH